MLQGPVLWPILVLMVAVAVGVATWTVVIVRWVYAMREEFNDDIQTTRESFLRELQEVKEGLMDRISDSMNELGKENRERYHKMDGSVKTLVEFHRHDITRLGDEIVGLKLTIARAKLNGETEERRRPHQSNR